MPALRHTDIKGTGSDDRLVGTSGPDDMHALGGNDYVNGGAGNDTLTGNAGADYFVMDPGGGDDVITDFTLHTNAGSDHIVFEGFGNLGGAVLPERLYDGEVLHTTGGHTLTITADGHGGTLFSWETGDSVHVLGTGPAEFPSYVLTVVDSFQYWIP